tara:strand:+ start:7128 stop:8018 length:891 start_codon:yes stop_codon:yes gene_type:complete
MTANYIFSEDIKSFIDNSFDQFNDLRGEEISEDMLNKFTAVIDDAIANYQPWKSVYLTLLASLKLKGFDDKDLFADSIVKTIALEEDIMASDIESKYAIMAIAYYLAAEQCEEDSLDAEHEVHDKYNARSLYLKSYEYGYQDALVKAIRCEIFGLDGDIDFDSAYEHIVEAKELEIEEAPVYEALLKYFGLLVDSEDFSFNVFDILEFDLNIYDLRLLFVNELYHLASYIEVGHIPLEDSIYPLVVYQSILKLGAEDAKYDIERIYAEQPELRALFNQIETDFEKDYKEYKKNREN